MFVAKWIKSLAIKFSPRVSECRVRDALKPYELSTSVLEQLVAKVKTEHELEQVVLQASRTLWQEHIAIVCDNANAWARETDLPEQLLIAAQWIVGKNYLHPCFVQRDWLSQQSAQRFDCIWAEISRYSVADYLRVHPDPNSLYVVCEGAPKTIHFSELTSQHELQFWLIFCNAVLVWGLTASGSNGARIRCEGALGNWATLAKYLEGLRSEF